MNIYVIVALFSFGLFKLLRLVNPFTEIKLFAVGMLFWLIAASGAFMVQMASDLTAIRDELIFLPWVAIILALFTPIQGLKYHQRFGYSKFIGFAYVSAPLLLLSVILYFVLGIHWIVALIVAAFAEILILQFSFTFIYPDIIKLSRTDV